MTRIESSGGLFDKIPAGNVRSASNSNYTQDKLFDFGDDENETTQTVTKFSDMGAQGTQTLGSLQDLLNDDREPDGIDTFRKFNSIQEADQYVIEHSWQNPNKPASTPVASNIEENCEKLCTNNSDTITLTDLFTDNGKNEIRDIFMDGSGYDLAMFAALGGTVANPFMGAISVTQLINGIQQKLDKDNDGVVTKGEIEAFKNSDEYKQARERILRMNS